jgi:eukaryotic-like serine/threonine-protein kinase
MGLIPGTVLGKYTIETCIGAGGFGRVYSAIQSGPAGFTRRVALKVMRGKRDASSALQAFAREARTIARLQHRNIVQVHDFGCEGDQYFLVMELVDGPTLAALQGSRPPLWLAVAVGQEVCRGLAFAHGLCDEDGQPLGMVHRDVKPSNVLVSRQGDVKLTDFGLAKMSLVADDSLTDVGVVKGTPHYMSPEQARGARVTPAADVFSLAAVIFELCADLTLGRGRAFELDRVDTARHGSLPGSLESLLRAALDPEPEARPSSAAFLTGLQATLAETAPPGQLPHLSEHLAEWTRGPVRATADGPGTLSTSIGPTDPFAPRPLPVTAADVGRHDDENAVTQVALARDGGIATQELATETQETLSSTHARRRLSPTGLLVLALLVIGLAAGAAWLAAGPTGGGVQGADGGARSPSAGADATPPVDRNGRREARPSPDQARQVDRTAPPAEARPATAVRGGEARSAEGRGGEARSAEGRGGEARSAEGRPSRPHHRPKRPGPRAAAAPGYLSVNADPWARVLVDGKIVGITPLYRLEVPSGWHELRFVGAERTITRRVHIEAGAHVRLGKLSLSSP